ncbi:MAG: hypothetical protein LUQ70_04285, partial [Methanobacteriaceae archaeon]|nr:hypothetical protein [Methanobacteriaceae archaeon]
MKHHHYEFVGAILLGMIFLALSLSSGSASTEKKHFDNGEVSFDYPAQWQQTTLSDSKMVGLENPQSGLKLSVSSQLVPQGWVKPENFINNLSESGEYSFKLLKSEKISINGTVAYQNTYEFKNNQSTSQIKEVWLEKNNAIYSIIFINPLGDMEDFMGTLAYRDQQEIKMVLESFSVHDFQHQDDE